MALGVTRARFNRVGFERLRSAADALRITPGDLRGPILTRLGQLHRDQERRIFATQGLEGGRNPWPPLSPAYAERKRRAVGRKPILVFTAKMKQSFVSPSDPDYVQRFTPTGTVGGMFSFGARSHKAARHFRGDPSTNLPERDMVTKSERQIAEMREALRRWYVEERLPQVLRGLERLGGRR